MSDSRLPTLLLNQNLVPMKVQHDFVLVAIRGTNTETWLPAAVWKRIAPYLGVTASFDDLLEPAQLQLLLRLNMLTPSGKAEDRKKGPLLKGVPFFGRTTGTDPQAEASIVCVPFDTGSQVSFGARKGPEHLRMVSRYLEGEWLPDLSGLVGWYIRDLWGGAYTLLRGARLNAFVAEPEKAVGSTDYLEQLTQSLVEELPAKQSVWMLGGDHSITYAGVRALARKTGKPVVLVFFDAHLDAAPPVEPVHSANVVGWLLDDPQLAAVYQIGNRGIVPEGPSRVQHPKLHIVSSVQDIPFSAFQEIAVYCSLDLDVLDPSVAPAVSSPVPNGLRLTELDEQLKFLHERAHIDAGDIVEYQQSKDEGMLTAQIVFRLLLTGLAISTGHLEPSKTTEV
ncbi:arginase family protein [Tumebacillus lipolyticus]|uniref:Arginase family protein n=1 Tax=Tumebacillus lipolyticus TaxID=1280370 RepID=A0ABW4ZYF2_9BACL